MDCRWFAKLSRYGCRRRVLLTLLLLAISVVLQTGDGGQAARDGSENPRYKSPWGSNSRHSLYVIAFITSTWPEFESREFAQTRVAHTRDVLCGTWGHILQSGVHVCPGAMRRPWKPIMKYHRRCKFPPNVGYLQIVRLTRRVIATLSSTLASNLGFSSLPMLQP